MYIEKINRVKIFVERKETLYALKFSFLLLLTKLFVIHIEDLSNENSNNWGKNV